jgi:PPOX class probable F420-dependent enzyme
MPTLDARAQELLRAKNFCHVSTLREDGTILTVPVWVDTDGEHIVVNSAEGRSWPANLRRTGHATCTITNHEDPYEYVSATVAIAEDTHEGADETIDRLAKKYLDEDTYPFRKPGEQRVTFRLRPERLTHHGG